MFFIFQDRAAVGALQKQIQTIAAIFDPSDGIAFLFQQFPERISQRTSSSTGNSFIVFPPLLSI